MSIELVGDGDDGAPGANGANGTPFNLGTPASISPVLGTALQLSASKPARATVMVRADYALTVAGNLSDTIELRIGATAAAAQGGAGGVQVAECVFGLTGIALSVGMGIQQQNQMTADVPAGWYVCVRRTSGSRAAIVSAIKQDLA